MTEKNKTNEQIACNNWELIGRVKERERILQMFDEEEIYPIDVFPKIEDYQLKEINNLLLNKLGFPLDRLSAEIGRRLLIGLKKKIGKKQ